VTRSPIGIRSIATALPKRFSEVENLETSSSPEVLRDFGFEGAWIDGHVPELALRSGWNALNHARIDASQVDALFWISALSANHEHNSEAEGDPSVLNRFCYRGSWLQECLGLDRATVSGVAQQGCAGMFSGMRQAWALLSAEPELSHVLCVAADALPPGAQREILYNLISDAGCACVMSSEHVLYRWVAYHQVSKGYYWDVPARQSEIIAAYFPTAALTIRGVFQKANLRADEIDLVIPTGVNADSWPILLRLCGIPEDRLYQPRQSRGHTIAADSLLILEEAKAEGALRPGMKLLLFAYGFGSSWCALILETTDLIEA
jgi:3-oxoacyl-[acyl-carrier-protein] synthase III